MDSYGVGAEYAFNDQLSAMLQLDKYNLRFANKSRYTIDSTSMGQRYKVLG